jgi:hypothetical protein
MSARDEMLSRLHAAAERDERIVGLLDYGSGSFGRADEWSDVDVAVFLRDADLEPFTREWKAWAGQFGRLLLAYVGHIGHPWTAYEAEPLPLRVDFDLHPESAMVRLPSWPNSPVSVESMVLYDGTGGRLKEIIRPLVGRSTRPSDLLAVFEQVCGDFWYYALYVLSKLGRGDAWTARQVYHLEVQRNLLLLLRLEADYTGEWFASPVAFRAERTLSPERLARLDATVPLPGAAGLRPAMYAAAMLGREVCGRLADRYHQEWPEELARRVTELCAG